MVDLLFFELMSHLSHVKQMNSQPVHLTHELILCIQITRGRIKFNGDSTGKSPCWHQISNLPTHMIFNLQPYLTYWNWPFSWLHTVGPVLWGTSLQQLPASCHEHSPDFPRTCMPWKTHISLAYLLPPATGPSFFVSSFWSSQTVSHPSTIQAQYS